MVSLKSPRYTNPNNWSLYIQFICNIYFSFENICIKFSIRDLKRKHLFPLTNLCAIPADLQYTPSWVSYIFNENGIYIYR